MHGAQDPKLRLDHTKFNAYMVKNNKEFLESEIKKFLKDKNLDVKNLTEIFITGDFNDRYDGIKEFDIDGKIDKDMNHHIRSFFTGGEIQI
jgi:hypothetical protein